MSLLGKSGSGPTIGIDIGSSLIKVVEAKPGKDSIQVTALGVAPTPPGAIDNEIVVDPQALGQAIRQLLSDSGISCKRCVSSVSGQSSVIVRIIDVPKMTRQELAETMKWEVERHVPFAANDVVMDYEPVERASGNPDDENMEVLLAVAQQEVVTSHLEALFAAGLDPAAIDVEPLASCRSLIDASQNGESQQTIAIVNIGAAATELGVYQNGLLAFPRTLPIAGDTITRSISEAFGISQEEAEKAKRERGVVLLDRVAQIPAADVMSGFGASNGYGESNATIDISDVQQQPQDSVDMGFIPGLGFGFGADQEPKAEASSPGGLPDFDVDIEGTPEPAARPVIDFDLSMGEDTPDVAPNMYQDVAPPVSENIAESGDLQPAPSHELSLVEQPAVNAPEEYSKEQVFDAMAPVLGDLVAEIRRSLEYYVGRFQGQPNKVLLCGGSAKLGNLDKYLESELGIPTVIANPLSNVSLFSRNHSEDYLEEVAMVFPVSVGLAIRDMIGE